MGRSTGGVHWRSDNIRSLRLGETVAIPFPHALRDTTGRKPRPDGGFRATPPHVRSFGDQDVTDHTGERVPRSSSAAAARRRGYSALCRPSQSGDFAVCLQPQNHTRPSCAAVYCIGAMPLPL